jgi:phage shock protein C
MTDAPPGDFPPSPPPQQQPSPRPYRFVRSHNDKKVGGVCGAIARDLNVDPTLVRILTVVVAIATGFGFLAYLAAWILAPQAAPHEEFARPIMSRGSIPWDRRQLGGAALVGLGGLVLLDRIGLGVDGNVTFPLLLIGGGVAVLWQRREALASGGSTSGTTVPGSKNGPTSSWQSPSGYSTPQASSTAFTGSPTSDPVQTTFANDTFQFQPGSYQMTTPVQPVAVKPSRGWPKAAWGLLLLTTGVLALFAGAGNLSPTAAVAWIVAAIGSALIIGGKFGRPRGFILVGVLASMLLGLLAVADVSWRGGNGDITIQPTAATIQRSYRHRFGVMRVDLSKLDLRGKRADLNLEVSGGALSIEVPEGVGIDMTSRAGFGAIGYFGNEDGGISHNRRIVRPEVNGAGVVHIDAKVGAGAIEIARVGRLQNITRENVNFDFGDDAGDQFGDRLGDEVELPR